MDFPDGCSDRLCSCHFNHILYKNIQKFFVEIKHQPDAVKKMAGKTGLILPKSCIPDWAV